MAISIESTLSDLHRPVIGDLPRLHDRSSPADVARTIDVVGSADLARPRARTTPASERAINAINVTIAATALLLLSPLLVLVAIIIKLTSPGPIFYMQSRVGIDRRRRGGTDFYDRRIQDLGGRIFTIYKFRSMSVDSERTGAVWATRQDARVTRIGRIIRKTRIDELPQLINVVKGDMNIVGPRPERPSIFVRLRGQIDQYQDRQQAKPGITGWAQINNPYDTCLDDVRRKVALDLQYLERRCVLEDLKIMAMTLPVMIFRKGGW